MSSFQTQGTVTEITVTPSDYQGKPTNKFQITLDNGLVLGMFGGKELPNGKDAQGNWQPISKGTSISATYTQNGTYNNTKSGLVQVLASGNGSAPLAATPGPAVNQAAPPTYAAPPAAGPTPDIDPTFAVGRWVNGATALVQSGKAADLKDGIKQVASIELWTTVHFANILKEAKASLSGVPQQVQQVPPASPAPAAPAASPSAPAPVSNDVPFNDDIPF